jgi:hypothetical protein
MGKGCLGIMLSLIGSRLTACLQTASSGVVVRDEDVGT